MEGKYQCPCCKNYTLDEEPYNHTYEICPVCFWEDDTSDDNEVSQANGGLTLIEARQNYENFGVCDEKFEGVVELMEEDGIV